MLRVSRGMEIVEAPIAMAKRRILVVEDDNTLANMYRSALCFAGYEVDVAGDGLTALEDIDTDHPDLVVLDLNLPQLGGDRILSEVAATPDTRDIPVIVVTGADHVAATGRVSAVLRKPCDPGDLVALVEQTLH
jgi:DNA-binding response OmpR family regulator